MNQEQLKARAMDVVAEHCLGWAMAGSPDVVFLYDADRDLYGSASRKEVAATLRQLWPNDADRAVAAMNGERGEKWAVALSREAVVWFMVSGRMLPPSGQA